MELQCLDLSIQRQRDTGSLGAGECKKKKTFSSSTVNQFNSR